MIRVLYSILNVCEVLCMCKYLRKFSEHTEECGTPQHTTKKCYYASGEGEPVKVFRARRRLLYIFWQFQSSTLACFYVVAKL